MCMCGMCTPDRVAGEPGEVLATVLSNSLDEARRLENQAGFMGKLAAGFTAGREANLLLKWAELNRLAADRIRSLVSELCLLSQGIY